MVYYEECILITYNRNHGDNIDPNSIFTEMFIYEHVNPAVFYIYENFNFVESYSGGHPDLESEEFRRKNVAKYTQVYDKYVIPRSEILLNEYKVCNCDIANRLVVKQRLATEEIVYNYVVNLRENYFNEEMDLLRDTIYIVDRSDDFQSLIDLFVRDVDTSQIFENVLLYVEDENNNNIYGLVAIYNKQLKNTIFNEKGFTYNNLKIKKVIQMWVVDEVNDIIKLHRNSYEGSIIFRNFDNEIIVR